DGKDPAEGCAHGEMLVAPCALGGWNPPVRSKPSWDRLENPAEGLEPGSWSNGTFNLTCNSSLSADTLLWLWNMIYLATDQQLELSPSNWTLTVLNVTRGDAGAYHHGDAATTGVRHELITWGSLTDLLRPTTLGSPLTLMCITDSVPPSHYLWLHNGTDANETRSRWTINPMTCDQQGTCMCQAHNPDTIITAQVLAKASWGCSAGDVTGLGPWVLSGPGGDCGL
uniref:Ig-like domain-containing protein n=1 Tax=Pelusios castaneus TaxID=367368 RepID=A0A8C8S3X9_9SAUR